MNIATHYFTPQGGPALNVAKRGTGLPVLFQHGLCGAASQPQEVFPIDVTAQCHTVECRGHGHSHAGDIDTYSIALFTDDCAEYLSNNFTEPVIVGGISMGAAIALRLAIKRPDLVKGLILARPAWIWESCPPNAAPNIEVGSLLDQHDAITAEEIFRRSDTYQSLSQYAPDNLASLLGFFQRQPQVVTAALLQKIAGGGPEVTEAEVKSIIVPTLVIGHGRDAIHPLAFAEELTDLMPRATLARITPKAENKAAYITDFQSALRNFLRGFII